MRRTGPSYYILTEEQRLEKLQPGTLWQSKDSWNFAAGKCKKNEIVMIVSSTPFIDDRWENEEDKQKLRTHVQFMAKKKVITLSIPVQSWFVWFREIS